MKKSSDWVSIEDFKKTFDADFDVYLKTKLSRLQKKLGSTRVNTLLDYIYVLSGSGKRFRPYLLYCAYKNCGGRKDIKPFLFGIELLHIFALVHDDIMDQSSMRHGQKTAHTKYLEHYTKNSPHTALSQAILLGDLLFSFAEECFFQVTKALPLRNMEAAQAEYRTLAEEVIYGQMLDIDMTEVPPSNKKDIYTKMALKSGRYSIMRPLLIGAKLAGANTEDIQFLTKYGENVGIAFQLQDDLLDCTAEVSFGKKLFGDIQTSQQTYLSYYLLNNASTKHQEEFRSFFGQKKKYTLDQTVNLKKLLTESGALAFVQKEITKHFKQAEKHLSNYPNNNNQLWLHILNSLQDRKK